AQRGAPTARGERSGPAPQRIVERKPHPHAAAAASASAPAASHPPKPGFFRRIMRMFTAR
ncbi:hypothetical protein, partial [Dokdonella sp.]|uniref:hypothetical protein n=1 Tax=Dokdonella sp. TaxID=2291710 RepID=UPI002F40A9B8